MSTDGPLGNARLGYLLKHAYLGYAEMSREALAPYEIDGRELAVLTRLAGPEPLSQQEAARQLGIDRTTMVALVDALERKQLVGRRPDPEDRRKNIVELTAAGRTTLAGATQAADRAEQQFLGALGPAAGESLKEALRTLLSAGLSAEPSAEPSAGS